MVIIIITPNTKVKEIKYYFIFIFEEYLAIIENYLRELIEEYKLKGEWKVQLTAKINFIPLKPGSDETRIMHTRSDNIEIRIGDDIKDVIKELFKSFRRDIKKIYKKKNERIRIWIGWC